MSPFVHPGIFWGGLALLAIPIIIHLLNRRRLRRLEWAAMAFLIDAARRNRRRLRLEGLLLLALRTLVVALVVLAASRPTLEGRARGLLGMPFSGEEQVFIVDDSLSTGKVEDGRTALDRAAGAVLGALERMATSGRRDPVTVILASRPAAPLLRSSPLDEGKFERLRSVLGPGRLRPTDGRMDLAAILDGLGEPAGGAPRSTWIATDLCVPDWTDGRGGPQERIAAAIAGAGKPSRLSILDVGSRDRDNLAIVGLGLEARNAVAGIPAELRIEVANLGGRPVRDIGIRLRSEGSAVPGPRIDGILPGKTAVVRATHTWPEAGPCWISAEVDGGADGLPADDRRFLAVQVSPALEVLIVDGGPATEPDGGEAALLARALRPAGSTPSGLLPEVIGEAALGREDLSRRDAVVLADVRDLPAEAGESLVRFVDGGGGLLIFPGGRADPDRYKKVLGNPGDPGPGLLPAAIGEVAGDDANPLRLEPSPDHPAFRLLAGGGLELLGLVGIRKHRELLPAPAARVLARLADPGRSPAIVEAPFGRGKVVLAAFPPGLGWTDWPRSPTFLPVMVELVAAAARPRSQAGNHRTGAAIEVPLDLARHRREALLRDPGYPRTPERKLLAVPAGETAGRAGADPLESAFRFRIDDTGRAGIYGIVLGTVDGAAETRLAAASPDPAESDLRRIDAAALRDLYPGAAIDVIGDPEALGRGGGGGGEAASLALGLVLGLLLVEGALAAAFAHHRREVR